MNEEEHLRELVEKAALNLASRTIFYEYQTVAVKGAPTFQESLEQCVKSGWQMIESTFNREHDGDFYICILKRERQ